MMISEVELCRFNSSNLPVLKEEEMNELLFKLQHGDYECKETFIKANTRLILSIIQRFNNREKNADDIFKVGCNALMKSIYKFNLSLNVRFSTYAAPIIIEEIRKYLRVNNEIRISESLRNIAYSALQVRDRLVCLGNKEPAISQIAKELKLPREEVVFALDALQQLKGYRLGKNALKSNIK